MSWSLNGTSIIYDNMYLSTEGESSTRSMHLEQEPNISPFGPTKLIQYAFYHILWYEQLIVANFEKCFKQ